MSRKRKGPDLEAQKASVELAQIAYQFNRELVTDPLRSGHFFLDGEISDETSIPLVRQLEAYAKLTPQGPVLLDIFSEGGSMAAGFQIYDTLRGMTQRGHQVTTRVRAVASSMAAVVYLAGETRLIGEQGVLMFHEPSNAVGGPLTTVKEGADELAREHQQMRRIILDRTTIKAKRLDKKVLRRNWVLEAKASLTHGMAHEVG